MLALEVLSGRGALLQLEGDADVVDAVVEGDDGEAIKSAQMKTRVEPYVWHPGEIVAVVQDWLATEPAEDEQFYFVTDGSLGPGVANELVPALRHLADGTHTEEDLAELRELGLDPDDDALKRVTIHSRAPSGQDLLEGATLELISLREATAPLTTDEAGETILALFGRLVFDAGAEREQRRIQRAEIAGSLGVSLESIDDATSWSLEVEKRYRAAVSQGESDPAWTLLNLLEAHRPPALSYVRPRDNDTGGLAVAFAAGKLLDTPHSALLEGPAGAGKTVTLTQLSRDACEQGQLPITLRLASYVGGTLGHRLHQSLEQRLGAPLAPRTVDLLLSRSSTVVLVDGAGELIPEQRTSVITDLLEMRDRNPGGARFVVSARSRLSLVELGLEEFVLQGLSDEQRESIAKGLGQDAAVVRDVVGELGDVVDNPLLFTMAVGLRARGRTARTRAELFAGFVEGLEAREEGGRVSALALAAIEAACYELRGQGRFSAEEWWWLESIGRSRSTLIERGLYDEDAPVAANLLEELIEVGLVRRIGTGSDLGLLHDLFSDWFAAEAIRSHLAPFPDSVSEHLEEAITFLAELDALSDDEVERVAGNPIAAARVRDRMPTRELDTGVTAQLWSVLLGSLGPDLIRYHRDLDVRVSDGFTYLVPPDIAGDSFDPRAARLSTTLREPASPLAAAVDLWMAALRLKLRRSEWVRPVVPAEDAVEMAAQLGVAAAVRAEECGTLIEELVPSLGERVTREVGPLGLRGWLLPAEDVQGVPGTGQTLREHRLLYTASNDVAITPVDDEDEIPADRGSLAVMVAESYLDEAPLPAAIKLVSDALGQLMPRFDD